MPRKTKAQLLEEDRAEKAKIGHLLADLDAAGADFRKAAKRYDDLKAVVRLLGLEPGTYGEMTFAEGTPREILDQAEAKKLLTEHGIVVPTTMTAPPLVVKSVAK